MTLPLLACWCLLGSLALGGATTTTETARYLRPAGTTYATECEFTLKRDKAGWSIESVTRRGATTMIVSARFDAKDVLISAAATLAGTNAKQSAQVRMNGGKAAVRREGKPALNFDVAAGVIVTSAPDWTDTFLLCRRYDRARGGRQEFAGLWIHPTEPCRRLTFIIERDGAAMLEHAGKRVRLDRYTIQLRGGSRYVAWADADGRMIRLVPLPVRAGVVSGLVREGYEKTALSLRP